MIILNCFYLKITLPGDMGVFDRKVAYMSCFITAKVRLTPLQRSLHVIKVKNTYN